MPSTVTPSTTTIVYTIVLATAVVDTVIIFLCDVLYCTVRTVLQVDGAHAQHRTDAVQGQQAECGYVQPRLGHVQQDNARHQTPTGSVSHPQ
jgi:hypothetical protein